MNRASVAPEPSLGRINPKKLSILVNDQLEVIFAAGRGGKLLSFSSRSTGTEWLLPPLRPYEEAKTTGGFEEWDGGGFDECLPTVAPTETAPDHGEVWRYVWQRETAKNAVLLRTTALGGAIAFERRARLEVASLVLDYAVENRSDTPQSLIYSAHPLLRVEQGDRILLPAEVREVKVGGSAGDRLGQRGARVAWPKQTTGEDLSVVGPPDGLQADKVFAGPMSDGWCALVRPSLDEALELTFSSDVLPYLGLWICRAAWPESGAAKQYTIAFEPASSPHDSLADADRDGTAWRLAPGDRRAWRLSFRLGTRQEMEVHAWRAQ